VRERRVRARRVRAEKSEGEKSEGERESEGEKSEGEKSEGEKSEGEKSEGEKSEGEKSEGEKSEGEKSEGEKSEGEKSEGEKSEGEKSEGEKAVPRGPPPTPSRSRRTRCLWRSAQLLASYPVSPSCSLDHRQGRSPCSFALAPVHATRQHVAASGTGGQPVAQHEIDLGEQASSFPVAGHICRATPNGTGGPA